MGWAGTFVLGRGYAAYFGKAGANTAHQHGAIQLVLATENNAAVYDQHGNCTSARRILIRPLIPHKLRAVSDLVSIYVEPQTELGRALLEEASYMGISAFEETKHLMFDDDDPESILTKLDVLAIRPSVEIDVRLLNAMNLLGQTDTQSLISDAAKASGVSVSTLRLLAKRDLGLPLGTWLVWRKLGRAAKALSENASLVEAAYVGGFSDQAHFCRVMKRMFGITPRTAAKILKWRSRNQSIAYAGRF